MTREYIITAKGKAAVRTAKKFLSSEIDRILTRVAKDGKTSVAELTSIGVSKANAQKAIRFMVSQGYLRAK